MNPVTKYALSLLLLMSFGVTLQAQGLPGGEVDVVKNFEARLLETDKVGINPELPPLDTTTKRQNYNVTTKPLNVEYLPPKIRPLAMRGDDLGTTYNGYARLGAGLPGAFLAEGAYRVTNIKNLDLGFLARHHSANNTRKVENQRFSNNNLGVDGTYYFDQGFAVNGKLGYSRNYVHFYGYNELNEELDTNLFSFEPNEVKQRFSIFDMNASIFNGARTAADFNYRAGVDLYLMQDNYASRENGFRLSLDATKWFGNSNPLTIKLITDFTTFKNGGKDNLNNFFLQPSYTYHGGAFKAKVGVNIASHEDEFSFFPDIEVGANIVEGVLGAFVGAEGSLQKNTFRTLSDYNPFIESRIRIRNTRYYHFYGGIKGNFQGINYNAQVGYKTTDDLALFLLSSQRDSIARFDVLYDTVNIFLIKASITAPLFKGFELTGTLSQSIFSPQREEKAWHLPSFTVNAAARYLTLEDKVRFTGEFFLENGVPYRNEAGEVKYLNTLFDISAGVEYFFTDNFGGFLQVNNLANNRRQRWQRYPTLGLNALIGISARF